MAINYSVRYPSNSTPPDSNYTYGSAKNSTAPGAKNGSPFEKDYINDIIGFQQAIFLSSDIVPNGSAENENLSQYLQGLRTINASQAGVIFLTVANMKVGKPINGIAGDITLRLGDFIQIKERDNQLFQITNDAANGFDIIETTLSGLSATYALLTQISDLAFGLKNDGTDENVAINAFFQSSYDVLFFKGNGNGTNYKSSKTIQTGADKEIFWGNVILESITLVDLGAVISFATGNIVYNPHVNGGGPTLIVGSSGQNGYGANGKVVIYNPIADDCARGISTPFDGGKGFQSEGSSSDVTIYNMHAEKCHIAISSRKDGATGTGNHLKVFGLKAIDCNHISFSGQANVNTLDPQVYSVLITGVDAQNIGALDALQDADAGLFIGSRAANVQINDVTISGTTKLKGVVRGRFRNSRIFDVRVTGDYLSIVNIDPVPVIAIDTSLTENCYYDIDVNGTQDYLYLSDLTDATHPNRFANNSTFNFNLKNDVVTAIVSPATRNGDSRIDAKLDAKIASYSASKWNNTFSNMSAISDSSERDYEEGNWTPVYEGTTGSIGATAYTEQSGSYVKIGKMVYLSGFITLSNKGSWTGNVQIAGVPFNSAGAGAEAQGSVELRSVTFAQKYATVEIGRAANNLILPRLIDTAVGTIGLPTSGVAATSTFSFSIAYKTT